MSDCPNAEVRDLLPELLHDRLDAPVRAQVLAHVNGCADCRSELELLRSMRGTLHRGTPRVDVNRIVAALPTSARPAQRRGWRVLNDWRVAAAVTFLVAGGTSMIVIRNARDAGRDSTATPAVRPVTTVASETTTNVRPPAETASHPAAATSIPNHPRAVTPPVSRATEAVASTNDQGASLGNSRINDLSSRQLKSLLNDIDHMDATPITDPEPVTLRVGARTASPTGL
jgi:Putative zinc-finger